MTEYTMPSEDTAETEVPAFGHWVLADISSKQRTYKNCESDKGVSQWPHTKRERPRRPQQGEPLEGGHGCAI